MAIQFTPYGLRSVQDKVSPASAFQSIVSRGGTTRMLNSSSRFSNIRTAFSRIFYSPKTVLGRPLVSGAVPFSPAGGIATSAGFLGRTGTRAMSGIKKLGQYLGIGQPQTLTQVAKNIALFGGAYAGGTYAATGELPKPSLRTLAGYAGAQINLPATIFGAIHGVGTKTIEKLQEQLPNLGTSSPNIPTFGGVSFETPDIFKNLKIPENFTSPSANIALPSYAPSLSVGAGGGLSEITPLLLALLAGAGGGYFLGKKKRKKKKYKKRKRR